jgi:hypothetical protein
MGIPVVDILYFVGTIVLVTGMAVFIVRSMRSSDQEDSNSPDAD